MDRSDCRLSEQATAILRLIAEGRSYDQILLRRPDLTYQDIFAAAQEALTKLEAAQGTESGRRPAEWPAFPARTVHTHDPPPSHQAAEQTPWTPVEDEQLARLFRRDAHLAEIGQALGRHNGAIKRRLVQLGLLAEDADPPDQLLAPGGHHTPPVEEPAPPRSAAAWDMMRRRLEGGPGQT